MHYDALQCAPLLLSRRCRVSGMRLTDGTDYESRRTLRRTQQNFFCHSRVGKSGLGGGKNGTRRILALVSH